MITSINLTILLFWFLSAVVDYSDYGYLWQLKEYRLDRMRDFFSTKQGKLYLLRYQMLWRSFLVLVAAFWPLNETLVLKHAIITLFGIDILHTLYRIIRHKIRHPRLTAKAAIVVAGSLLLEGAIFVFTHDWSVLLMLMVGRFFIMSFVVQCLSVPTRQLKQYYIKKATTKIASYPKLTVIGVTGSFGKSSVKEFLAHILSGKYSVIRTPLNINTEIGVAKFILNSSFEGKDIFIVEMGAYTTGEIGLICSMVRPKIGILTAINEQHLSLFGSIENTQKAKYELLRSLPKDGLAITNSDNTYCREFLGELACRAQTFGYDTEFHPDCTITEVQKTSGGVMCVLSLKGNSSLPITTPLIGEYHCMNIAPCVLAGLYLKLTIEEIRELCATLPQTGVRKYRYGNCTIIDDSYNSNPTGFKSALSVMSSFPSDRRRVVITRGMLELGDKSDELHERIGEEIAFTANELVLLTRDSEAPLRKGIGNKYRTTIVVKDDPSELLEYMRDLKQSNSVILLENRIPSIVYNEVTKRT